MLNIDEENYQEAMDSAFKVSVTRGISKYNYSVCIYASFGHNKHNVLSGLKESC